jgi:hypothetical protein
MSETEKKYKGLPEKHDNPEAHEIIERAAKDSVKAGFALAVVYNPYPDEFEENYGYAIPEGVSLLYPYNTLLGWVGSDGGWIPA